MDKCQIGIDIITGIPDRCHNSIEINSIIGIKDKCQIDIGIITGIPDKCHISIDIISDIPDRPDVTGPGFTVPHQWTRDHQLWGCCICKPKCNKICMQQIDASILDQSTKSTGGSTWVQTGCFFRRSDKESEHPCTKSQPQIPRIPRIGDPEGPRDNP